MKWFSIEERIPKDNGLYHVRRKWSENIPAYGTALFKDGEFDHYMDDIAGEITHWMKDKRCRREHG